MNRLRAWIRSFFGFSRTETNAFLILLPLMIVLVFSEPLYRYWFVRQPQDFSASAKELDSLIASWKWEAPDSILKSEAPPLKLFSFNPNHATPEELMQLGFRNSIANRIVNYRAKGGKFQVKNDLRKIYGMDSTLFNRLYSYIELPERILKKEELKKFVLKEKPKKEKFDLNTADTIQLKKIYGIGTKLSQRIVAYRDKLGGFVSTEQLKEVYGLDSMVVKELINKSFLDINYIPKQIDLNRASEQELGAHPYIKYKLAKAITAYRFQHGPFKALEELSGLALMDERKFERIKPYLSIKP